MLKSIVNRVFGTRHDRERRRVAPIVDAINEQYERLQGVSEAELRGQTAKFREILRERTAELEARIAELKAAKHDTSDAAERERLDAELSGLDGRGGLEAELRETIAEVLDEILPEAFATAREAARRLSGSTVNVTGTELTWDMVHYDVQLIGGVQLHMGKIAEMATGEGKTLVATLPLYLNAIPARGAHLVTVNNYLARRDSQWMGHLYTYLGLTVGCIDDTEPGTPERRAAYECDITYGTNNEFGFDYLRDNMVTSLDQRVQRPHWFAIVDEVDSVLIDEARTPLIISGPVGNEGDVMYAEHNDKVQRLVRRQNEMVNGLVGEGERALESGDTSTASLLLFKAQLGAPKNKRLLKAYQESGVKQLVQRMELDYLADRKLPASKQQYRDLEDDLLYVLDEKGHTVHLTDRGVDFLAPQNHDEFVLPDISTEVHRIEHDHDLSASEKLEQRRAVEIEYARKSEVLHIVHQLLRAHALYEKDVNYVVQEGQVLIVDEYTGRTMPGRRWSEGLHQAVEAKERVQVKGETQTMATITIQNYFRLYEKLAGMTGTAETEEGEFHQIYGLEVAVIPTNRPIARDDRQDLIYKTRREKYNAIVEETRRLHELGLPVLVGTTSVEASETLARLFARAGLKHNVLNAKYHQREAEIVAMAGQPGAITIATNMAGRGTDIKLGAGVKESRPSTVKDLDGKDVEVTEDGGLHIIGSERHESRRIDRQLRGRAGRQGDPGASQFFLSLEDDLMRLFGSERIAKLMDRLGAQDGEVLTHPMITRSIESAQKRVELQNFQQRKRLLEYDDVMNQQREVIYSLRAFALEGGEELKGEARKMVEKALARRVETTLGEFAEDDAEAWDPALLRQDLLMHYLVTVPAFEAENGTEPARPASVADAQALASTAGLEAFDRKIKELDDVTDDGGQGYGERLLALVMLNVLDEKWKDHLYDLDQLRAAIHYRSWGQKDPLVEYKQEAYTMFVDLMNDVASTFTERFLKAQLVFDPMPPMDPYAGALPGGYDGGQAAPPSDGKKRRYNALGILEEIEETGPEQAAAGNGAHGDEPQIVEATYDAGSADDAPAAGEPQGAVDVGPAEPPAAPAAQPPVAARRDPAVVGAGPVRSLAAPQPLPAGDWSNVGRNDPCPCGSGKKFKKCHGAHL
ncbi:preprotein translocase subunit SecA [Roseisolibacter agri]|uniref:Protein translocase subunit SecA n=1 Tax=Roseisolibacter agri TaxID=2014610 RepID=A0AA37QD45_9BACT|nr:preprotein translocase subunit SecA [Roseisolibacter agri]GLC27556.1 protein translocase subunit SecA [Roseisolibacter agri]